MCVCVCVCEQSEEAFAIVNKAYKMMQDDKDRERCIEVRVCVFVCLFVCLCVYLCLITTTK